MSDTPISEIMLKALRYESKIGKPSDRANIARSLLAELLDGYTAPAPEARWIACASGSMPADGQETLIATRGRMGWIISTDQYQSSTHGWGVFTDVTHWQPLPAAPGAGTGATP
jgi:hypothetical protein